VNSSTLQFALRELRAIFASPKCWAALAVVSVVLGLSGPFGTYADWGQPALFAYWTVAVVATFAVGCFGMLLTFAIVGTRVRAQPLLLLIAGVLAGVPVTLTMLGINFFAYGGAGGMSPWPMWLYCTLITIAVVVGMALLVPPEREPSPAPSEPEPRSPPILERLSPPQRGTLLSLSVQDHYVDVRTSRGKTLLLMRLSDAMRETGGVAGLQIHRSHWVARDAVTQVLRSDGRTMLQLSDGTQLPVSRSFLPALKQAGFS